MFFYLPDGEQLAQPEFAGLWDKQAAFRPVGGTAVRANEMPRAKMCKASKMEQVCLILCTAWLTTEMPTQMPILVKFLLTFLPCLQPLSGLRVWFVAL